MKKDPSIWKGRGLSSSIHVPYSKLILNAIYTVQKSSLSFAFSMHFFPSKRLFIFLLFESGPNPYNSKFTYLLIFFVCIGSSLLCMGFSLRWLLLLQSMGSRCAGFSSCGARAQLLCGMWDLPRSGLEPVSPALAGGFLTTAPPGKPEQCFLIRGSLHPREHLSVSGDIFGWHDWGGAIDFQSIGAGVATKYPTVHRTATGSTLQNSRSKYKQCQDGETRDYKGQYLYYTRLGTGPIPTSQSRNIHNSGQKY